MICRRFQTDAMYCLGLSGVIDLFSLEGLHIFFFLYF